MSTQKKPLTESQTELRAFYKPYLSDSESDDSSYYSESDSESSSSPPPPPKSQIRQNPFVSSGAPISSGGDIKPPDRGGLNEPIAFKQTTTKFTAGKNSTTIMINSRDRDALVFPQPTLFTIRLPRVYRNVSGINITQIKLLSAFYQFSAQKNNTSMRIQEAGRTKTVNGVDVSNAISVYIRNGSYDAGSLVSELNNQLNRTPIYNRISYSDFTAQFLTTGNYNILFNDPGDTTYNPITGIFENLQSKSEIVSRYFKTLSNLGLQYYSSEQILVAYYYPMLRDITIGQLPNVTKLPDSPYFQRISAYVAPTTKTYDPINYFTNDPTVQELLLGTNYYDRIVYGFQGLSDAYILRVLQDDNNRAILDQFRSDNTWDGFLVNKYVCSYDSTVGRFTIYSKQLNTSLVTTLNNQYDTILVKELIKQGITTDQVAGIQTLSENYSGVLIDMYNFMQKAFTEFFAVDFGKYAPVFFTTPTNELILYDASGRYGWNLSYSGIPQSTNSTIDYPDASGFWPRIVLDPVKRKTFDGDLYYDPYGNDNYVRYTYTLQAPADEELGNLVLSGATEETLGYADISFNVFPTAYTKVIFKTRCRQQLFIETIPPFKDEAPGPGELAEQYYLDVSNTPLLFTNTAGTDCLLDPLASDFVFFDISQNMLDGPEYMRTVGPRAQIFLDFIRETRPIIGTTPPPSGYIGIYTFRPHVFFRILHAGYRVPIEAYNQPTKFKSDIYIEREDSKTFGTDLQFYWYRSRAAYMADVSANLSNIQFFNPKHYFLKQDLGKDVSSVKITTDFISFESSYGIVVNKNKLFSTINLRIFVLRHDPYGIYTYPDISDFRLMPVNYAYLNSKPPPIATFPAPFPSLFNSKGFRNSYDPNGVSNNVLDNMIITTDKSHYDPYSFDINTRIDQTPLRYSYQLQTKAIGPPTGISKWSQFFFSGSKNKILDTSGGTEYYNSTTAANEIANNLIPYKGISNEFVFTNWFLAGATTNLYNSALLPVPEQTIAPYPVGDNPFTIFTPIPYPVTYPISKNFGNLSPFAICKNKVIVGTDISFNDITGLGNSNGQIYLGPTINPTGSTIDISGIIGIPFIPMMGRFVIPTRVVLKFAYVQPSYNADGTFVSRNSNLFLTTGKQYRYASLATSPSTSASYTNDLGYFDDKYYQNRRNLVLGVFRLHDIFDTEGKINSNINNIKLSDALATMSLKKVTQVSQYSTNTDPTIAYSRNRTPDWGTYYVYEVDTSSSTDLWTCWGNELYGADGSPIPVNNITNGSYTKARWAVINKPADVSGTIYMKKFNSGDSMKSFYLDVSANGLCFIPFYPTFTNAEIATSQDQSPSTPAFSKPYDVSGNWAVGTFTGITYTTRPYLPVTKSQTLGENPWVFYYDADTYDPSTKKMASVCVEDVGGDAISMGDNTTYLGPPGPFVLGVSRTGVVCTPNSRPGKPFAPSFINCKINIKMVDKLYNPLDDLSKFGGLADVSKCLVDTQMYFYDTTLRPNSDWNDISGGWGMEKSNLFYRFDDDSGYNNLSYIPSIDVSRNSILAVNIRGYVPTVKFLSGLRIVGKNFTDFGKVSLTQLINEINDISNSNIKILPDGRLENDGVRLNLGYTYDYTKALILFNEHFKGEFTFGRSKNNASYPGITLNLNGFGDFLSRYIYYDQTIKTTAEGITIAQNNALIATQKFISDNYDGILPDIVLQRNRFTDPLTYSIQFKSALIEPYLSAYDQWGLGWNLGFDKVDTIYNTRHISVTFIRIVDDYIYLKLNDELNVNSIDISEKENLNDTRETFGQTQKYYGKLLLNNFGSFAQTFIQAAKTFTMPIGRLNKLTFEWVDAYNQSIQNTDCEFNVVLQIDEMIDTIDSTSIIVKGT